MHFILGTAGHIDHGKSSLIKALTGINPDRLPEEQKRGVTIELGFAHLEISGHEIGVIDVPGHADFVNNMVSGVGALDLAIFVVAADDGWMPQSEEHLHILHYLGIRNSIIALSKIDTCDDVEFVQELVREELEGSILADCPIIPVSSHTGEGLDTLREAIFEAAKNIKHDIKGRSARLHVDRVFSPQGVGTVVTGTLSGSEMSIGDHLMCYPLRQNTILRHIQMHNSDSPTASPGSRVGLNLTDIGIDQRGKPGIRRGCLLAPAGLERSDTIDVKISRLDREIPGQTATQRPLKNAESVIVHIGTARVKARVILNNDTTLATGAETFAQLRLEESMVCCIGDRFVLRDGGQQGTLGGGLVLDPLANPRKFRTPDRATRLQKRLEALDSPRTLLLDELQSKGILPQKTLIKNSPYSESAIIQASKKLTSEKKALGKAEFLVDKHWWQQAIEAAGIPILSYHRSHPDELAMPLGEWRAQLKAQKFRPEIHDILEEGLIGVGFQRKELGIYHQDHNLELPEKLRPIADAILKSLDSAALNPPILVELVDTPEKQQVLKYLIKSKQVFELSPKAVITMKHYQSAVESVTDLLKSNGPSTSSDIRKIIDTSRKVLIPLLESMDASGITKRDGDFRKLA